MNNRLGNSHNPYQGSWKKVLCVCSAGLLRSPTMAFVLSNPPWNCNTRAAGISQEYALIPVDAVLMEWADEIICANEDHASTLTRLLGDCSNPDKSIHVLRLPDTFRTRDPNLMRLIEQELARVGFVGTE